MEKEMKYDMGHYNDLAYNMEEGLVESWDNWDR